MPDVMQQLQWLGLYLPVPTRIRASVDTRDNARLIAFENVERVASRMEQRCSVPLPSTKLFCVQSIVEMLALFHDVPILIFFKKLLRTLIRQRIIKL